MDIQSRLAQVQDPDFWRQINPGLSIHEASQSGDVLSVDWEYLEELLLSLKQDGYFQIEPILPELDLMRMAIGIEILRQEGWPAIFAFVYDEVWLALRRLSPILSIILGKDYQQLPSFWAWYLNPNQNEAGWKGHRDRSFNTLQSDGMPSVLTLWIPLTDAIPLNGCIYVLPAAFDPNYGKHFPQDYQQSFNFEDIRALPAAAGSVLGWSQALLHWGSRSSNRAPHPHISFSCEFQRADVEPYVKPLLDPYGLPDFHQRLALIGEQLVRYQHMYPLSEPLAELAMELQSQLPQPITIRQS